MTDVFEYLDYQFVRDGYTGRYSVYQNDRTIGQELEFIDAQAAADSDFRLRYPGHRILDQKPRSFRVEATIIGKDDSCERVFTTVIGYRYASAEKAAKDQWRLQFGWDCLIRDLVIREVFSSDDILSS